MTPLVMVLSSWALAATPGAERAREVIALEQGFVEERAGAVGAVPWWRSIDDPALAPLIRQALQGGSNVVISVARQEQAMRDAQGSLAPLLPRLTFDVGASGSPTDALGFQFGGLSGPSTANVLVGMETLQDINGDGIPDIALDPAYVSVDIPQEDTADLTWNGSALLNASWAVNFWGSSLQQHQASRHLARASQGDTEAAALATATMVAGAWYDLVMTNAQRRLVSEQVTANAQLLELVELRYNGGEASGLEVLQQRQQLAATEAMLPAVDQGVSRALLRLAVLLGKPAKSLLTDFSPGDELPALPPAPPTGSPEDLLYNRPDVVAVVERLDAAWYSRRSADRAFLPTLGLSANAGWQYFRQDELTSTDIWGIGASASVPLFNGGRNLAASRSARAGERATSLQVEQAVRLAVQEVDDALLFEKQAAAELAARQRQIEAARGAYDAARDRYIQGLVNLTTMLQTLTALQNAELSLIQSQRTVLSARIALHDALGGTWMRDGLLEGPTR